MPTTEHPTHSSAIPSDSTGTRRSALPSEQDDAVGDDLPSDESPDSEGDEASDDEIHDLALAVETSGLSPQGHEVTSQPNDDDQGEAIRIVTDAVELGGPGRPSGSGRRPGRRARRSGSAGPADLAEHFRESWIPRTGSRKTATSRSHTVPQSRPCGFAAPAAGSAVTLAKLRWSPGNWPPASEWFGRVLRGDPESSRLHVGGLFERERAGPAGSTHQPRIHAPGRGLPRPSGVGSGRSCLCPRVFTSWRKNWD